MFRILAAILICISLPLGLLAQSTWVDSQQEGDIIYLLRQSPSQIMRFDTASETWLSSLPLTEIPEALAIDSTHIFISYGRKIERIDLDGTNKVHVANSSDDIRELLIDANLLFANRTASLYARITILDKTNFTQIDTAEDYVNGVIGASISPTNRKIFGRSIGYSPSDLNYIEYNADGTYAETGDAPYHGDYPTADQTWLFPDESKVLDNSGTIYNTTDLTYANSFGTSIDDIAFHGTDIPILLVDDELIAYSNTLIETGRFQLGSSSEEVYISGGFAYVFFESDSSATGVAVEVVELSDFSVNTPGLPIDPNGLAYTVDGTAMDDSGTLYLLSKTHTSLFRWDTTNQEYLDSVPLPEAMDLVVYSPAQNCLYLSSASKRVYKIDLNLSTLAAVHHLTTPLEINTLMPLENDLFALINGSWDDQWIYASDGTLLNSNIDCCYNDYFFYDRNSSLLYYDNNTVTYLHDGTFGTIDSHGYNSSFNPIALSPNGQIMIDGGGKLYSSSSFAQIDTLSNDILDAGWDTSGTLFTVKKPDVSNATSVTLQKWTELLSGTEEVTVSGELIELYVDGDTIILLVDDNGTPIPYTFDNTLDLQAPATLETPSLAVDKFSATAATLSWNDIFGEENYQIERKLSTDANWQVLNTISIGQESFVDTTLTTGFVYQYRIQALNGATTSAYSNIVDVDLTAVIDDRIDPRTVQISLDDVLISDDDKLYILSKTHESIFVWDAVLQDWDQTIPLEGAPYDFAYASDNGALYTHYSNGTINSIDLSAANPIEISFANFSDYSSMHGIIGAGSYILVSVANSNWDDHYTLDAAGNIIDMAESRYEIEHGVWNSTNRNAYHFRDGTSPNDIIRTPIDTSGNIGNDDDSPYHSSTGISYPIRVKPDGTIILLGSGRIYNALTLEQIDSLSSTIDDAVWLDGELITLSSNRLYSHDSLTYGASLSLTPSHTAERILSRSDGHLILIQTKNNGDVTFDIFDGSSFSQLAPAVLATPTPLSANIVSATRVDLNWYDISGETGYRIERRLTGSGSWSLLGTTVAGMTTYIDTTVSVSNSYDYRVLATNTEGDSAPAEVSGVALLLPSTPSNFTAVPESAFEVELSWDAAAHATSYRLERKLSSSTNWSIIDTVDAANLHYTDSQLDPNTSYDYRIVAINGIGDSTASVQQNIVTDYATPTTTTFQYLTANATSIYLEWSHANYGDTYSLERRLSGLSDWTVVATLGAQYNNWTDNNVSPETSYEYRIRARNTAFNGPYSSIRNVTTAELLPPNQPSAASAITISASAIEVTWNDVADETGYRIERTTDGTPSWTTIADLPANTNVFLDTEVEEYFEYFYRVIAINDAGESIPSAETSATPYAIVSLLEDDFNNGYDNGVWAAISGGQVVDGGTGFRGSSALWFGQAGSRYAQTSPIDLSNGGLLSFKLRDGNLPPNSNYWEQSDYGEYIILEYTLNGIDWFTVGELSPTNPDNFGWSAFDIQVPSQAISTSTSFRFRQMSNSGSNYDTWGLEDFSITGRKPEPPTAPDYVIASTNSSSSITILWASSQGATSYQVERFDSILGWQLHATVSGNENYFTDSGLVADGFYTYRIIATNSGGSSNYSSIASSQTYTQWQEWRLVHYGTLEETEENKPGAFTPDGSSNLLKYAFNLSPLDSNVILNELSNEKGAPDVSFDQATECLMVEVLQRKQSSNPGISYKVMFSNDLKNWSEGETVLSRVSIDSTWEVVTYRCDLADKSGQFSKVVVTESSN